MGPENGATTVDCTLLSARQRCPARSMESATQGNLSAYDAEFVVLARRLGVPLVRADQAILDGAPDIAVAL